MRMVLIKKVLRLIYDFPNGRSQKTKVRSLFQNELYITYGVQE